MFVLELIDSNTLLWKFDGGRCFLQERANYYRSIVKKDPLQVNNLKGWFNRLDTLKNIIGSNVDFRNIISSDEK